MNNIMNLSQKRAAAMKQRKIRAGMLAERARLRAIWQERKSDPRFRFGHEGLDVQSRLDDIGVVLARHG